MTTPEPMSPITEDDIADYLVNTPDFFERHASLLATVQLTHPQSHRAVGLQERQAQMLRDKIKALEHRIMDMIRHGNENMILTDKLHRWSCDLLVAQPEYLAESASCAWGVTNNSHDQRCNLSVSTMFSLPCRIMSMMRCSKALILSRSICAWRSCKPTVRWLCGCVSCTVANKEAWRSKKSGVFTR